LNAVGGVILTSAARKPMEEESSQGPPLHTIMGRPQTKKATTATANDMTPSSRRASTIRAAIAETTEVNPPQSHTADVSLKSVAFWPDRWTTTTPPQMVMISKTQIAREIDAILCCVQNFARKIIGTIPCQLEENTVL